METKYELYKTACKKVKAKVVSALKLPNFPLCEGAKMVFVNDNVNNTIKAHCAGIYFDFMCNLKENEYLGALNWRKLVESTGDALDECPKLIGKTAPNGIHKYPDFCR